ncbi:MAG: N,N-dimethylformamidase beta subunit family domain-containing protein [Burkholderiaceae bacterium]
MNPIVAENARVGTSNWRLDQPATAREIEGYASATSVHRGEVIRLYVNTGAPTFVLEVFRMGWYQGLGARRVLGPVVVRGTRQLMPAMDPATGLVDCAWVNPFALMTSNPDDPADWATGVYLARLTAAECPNGREAQSYILFVVRDDGRQSDLLFQLSVTTYQAYNPWGGKSLYKWGSTEGERAAKVSFNRPYAANAQNPAAAYGMGAGEFLTNLQPHPDTYKVSNAGWDYNMLRWLEREGYDLAYCTNLDTHAMPGLPRRCKAWLSIGHDEYWSWEMRQHVEAARDAGVNLGFFSANCAYWQVRFEASTASGSADRIMVCYKAVARDPLFADSTDRSRATDKWRSAAIDRPEEQLIGVMYAGDPVDGDIVIKAAEHWVFAGTGLDAGAVLPGLLGYEVDRVHGGGPAGVEILAASPWTALTDAARNGVAHMSLYTAPSGALVFATGSIQWCWGLDDYNVPALRSSRLNASAQQATRNVLRCFVFRQGGVSGAG